MLQPRVPPTLGCTNTHSVLKSSLPCPSCIYSSASLTAMIWAGIMYTVLCTRASHSWLGGPRLSCGGDLSHRNNPKPDGRVRGTLHFVRHARPAPESVFFSPVRALVSVSVCSDPKEKVQYVERPGGVHPSATIVQVRQRRHRCSFRAVCCGSLGRRGAASARCRPQRRRAVAEAADMQGRAARGGRRRRL